MTARSLTLVLCLGLAGGWIASACFVDRKSDTLACTVQSDCTSPRVCENGYCVVDPNGCPSACTSCDLSVSPHVCIVDGTDGNNFTCPSGVKCEITCSSGSGSKSCNDITCAAGSQCTVMCSADGACDNVTCNGKSCTVACTTGNACNNLTCGGGDNGRCNLTCAVANACNNVTCSSACACDVTCGGTNACNAISCPRAPGNNKYCTPSQSDGEPCISSATNCDKC